MKFRFLNTFAWKLFVLFVVILCFPVLLIGAYSGIRMHEVMLNNGRTMNNANLKSIANSFNVYFEKYKAITDLVLVSDVIRELTLESSPDRVSRLTNDRRFASEINKLAVNTFDLHCVYLFTASGEEYFTYSNSNLNSVRERAQVFRESQNANRYASLGYDGIFIRQNPEQTPQYHILMLRALYSYVDREYMGTLVMEFKPQVFSSLLNYSDDITLVTDPVGTIVYDPTGENLQRNISELLDELDPDGNGDLTFERGRFIHSTAGTNYGFSITQFFDYNMLNRPVLTIQYQFISICLGCMLIFTLVAVFLSMRLVRPLKKLKMAMKRAENGDLTQHVSITTRDEFSELGSSYNHMLDQLNLYIERAYGEELRRLDAEYRALQAQINPHFLYNALETINSLAQINHQNEISQMVCSLATMFRYATVQHGDFVTLQQELEHVRNYLLVQRMSYEDHVIFEEIIPEAVLQLRIPKLILQPLVENCFNHGFASEREIFRVRLEAKYYDDILTLIVSDNGMGMDQAQLEQLHRELAEPLSFTKEKTSIGLGNIHHRLQLSFGSGSGISELVSAPGQGTKIIITIHRPHGEGGTECTAS